MNTFLEYIISHGVEQETIILILMLPVVATIISFARQIIGIKGFGIYTPVIISFAFWAIGLEFGLIFFATIIAIGTLSRFILRKLRLLYLPRMALVLTSVALAVLVVIFLSAYFNYKTEIGTLSIFAALIMVTLVERFIAAQIERGNKPAIILTLETLFLSIICYFVTISRPFQSFVLEEPEIIILGTFFINVLLGKWTGLRLTEYWRFRRVIKKI